MVVVDVLLGLNFLALGACALRGRSSRGKRSILPEFDRATSRPDRSTTGAAVILPFHRPSGSGAVRRAMSLHPSAR